jgi:O-antigen/teichoic acid export membrane protein
MEQHRTDSAPGWLRQRIVEGSLWLIALRWVLRGFSLVRTVVLARIIVPADFGLFTMTMLTLRMIEMPTSLDVDTALVRRADTDRALFDTAWTLRAMQRILVTIALLLGAPVAGWYFNDPRVTTAVRVAALVSSVWALENIGIVYFRKELAFTKEIGLTATTTAVGLTVTIVGAFLWRNYWALIAGFIAERLTWVAASYLFHPYRPRLSLTGWRELWRFSRWIPVQNAATTLRGSIDSFIVGRSLGAAQTGIYSMAGGVAGLAVAEIVSPISGTLLPSYARLANEPERLTRGYLDALGVMAVVVIASQIGIALIAPTFIPVVLGARWTDAVPAAQLLALHACVNVLSGSVAQILQVRGQMRRLTALIYVELVVYGVLLLWAAQRHDLTTLAAAKAGIALMLAPLWFAAVAFGSSLRPVEIARVLWRPLVAAAVMATAVVFLRALWPQPSFFALGAQITLGVTVFAAALTALWLAAGRPDGAERFALVWLNRRSWR